MVHCFDFPPSHQAHVVHSACHPHHRLIISHDAVIADVEGRISAYQGTGRKFTDGVPAPGCHGLLPVNISRFLPAVNTPAISFLSRPSPTQPVSYAIGICFFSICSTQIESPTCRSTSGLECCCVPCDSHRMLPGH